MPGIIGILRERCSAGVQSVTDPKLLAEFQRANNAVITALKDYEKYLKNDLLPRSNGDFRLGAETYAKKLVYEEMVDIPLDRLLQIGYDDLHANQERFAETAARIDPNKTPQQILAELEKDHPAPDKLLEAFRDDMRQAARFHHREEDHHDSVAGAADSGGDAAVHARADVRVHGYAGSVRDGRQGSVLQRDAARKRLDAGARRGFHGRVQSRHDSEHRDSRGVSRPLRAVPVDAARGFEGPQAARAPIRTPKAGRTIASR